MSTYSVTNLSGGPVSFDSGAAIGTSGVETVTIITPALMRLAQRGLVSIVPAPSIATSYRVANNTNSIVYIGQIKLGVGEALFTDTLTQEMLEAFNRFSVLVTPAPGALAPGGITPAMVGLGNASNTSDANKPVSTAQQAAIDLKANLVDAESTQTLHLGTVVASFLYDTSKDSDGGAWRKRCADKSWYTETICTGVWRGQQTEASCRAISGAATGDYFQSTADWLFYSLNAGSGVTQVYRGNKREFPAQALIIAEAARVVIYDATAPGCPMWMCFRTESGFWAYTSGTSVCALNGLLVHGSGTNGGLGRANFINDFAYLTIDGSNVYNATNISLRNAVRGDAVSGAWAVGIVSRAVNAIAMTVLPTAPIDPATGLPVPTIAVATYGGMSVIKDDGTGVNWLTDKGEIWSVSIDAKGGLLASGGAGVAWRSWILDRIPESSTNTYDRTFHSGSTPARLGNEGSNGQVLRSANFGQYRAFAVTDFGIHLLKENPAEPVKGMVNYISHLHTSGWQVGDIRRAWLADTVAGTVVGSDITPPDPANWVSVNGCTLTKSGSNFVLTKNGTQYYAEAYIPASVMVAGKKYEIQVTVVANANSQFLGIYQLVVGYLSTTDAAPVGHVRTVTGSAEGGNLGVVIVGAVDTSSITLTITCKLAEADRSVKNQAITVVGTLTKSAVASGAALMGYSGFSSSNYLQQAYSADLDFGTGDFCVMGWAYPQTSNVTMFCRCTPLTDTSLLAIYSNTSLDVYIAGSAAISAPALTMGVWTHVCFVRLSGVAYLYVNGLLVGQAANTANLSSSTATTCLGVYHYSGAITSPFVGSLSLWRFGATAPSADQISHIYRTEKELFNPGAQCTLASASSNVTALAYDDDTDTWHAGTAEARSSFKGLLRVDSEVVTATSLSASGGAILTGRASGATYYQPAVLLRDEIKRKAEARKALGKEPVFYEFDAVSGQTVFTLQQGYTVKAVYVAGTLKRIGSTKDYTVNTDGYRETVTFGTAPGSAAWVSIMAVRA